MLVTISQHACAGAPSAGVVAVCVALCAMVMGHEELMIDWATIGRQESRDGLLVVQ